MTTRRPSIRGFTLVEMVVVVAIIIITAALTLPAFSKIIQSTNYAQAVNTVTVTLSNARALAIRNGRHTGVAFLFDAGEQRYTLQVLELNGQQSGALTPFADGDDAGFSVRDAQAFRPADNSPPVELPPGTGVYGLSFLLADEAATIDSQTAHWYAGGRVTEPGGRDMWPWIFPRNDPRLYTDPLDAETGVGADPWPTIVGDGGPVPRPEADAAVRHAQTFFVQFTPEGRVSTTTNTGGANYVNAYIELPDAPLDLDDPDAGPWDDPFMFDPELDPPTSGPSERNPEVVLRAVASLAVVDLQELAEAPAINDPRPWLFRAEGYEDSQAPAPQWMNDYIDDDRVVAVSRWIDRNAQILAFNRYTGQVMRRTER